MIKILYLINNDCVYSKNNFIKLVYKINKKTLV